MDRLPPPPPPPLPPLLSDCFSRVIKSDTQSVFDGQNTQDESSSLLSKYGYLDKGKQYITCVMKTKSILQEGPTCGLVALLMAADALTLNHSYNLANLLETAQVKGFTEMGEMFSGRLHLSHSQCSHFFSLCCPCYSLFLLIFSFRVCWQFLLSITMNVVHSTCLFFLVAAQAMAELSEDLFHVKASLLTKLDNEVDDLVKHLATGLPVIVPYDCDKNHDPIMRGGKTAHWATLVGFAVEKDESEKHHVNSSPVIFKHPPLDSLEMNRIVSTANRGKNLLLFAKQGKSKFMRLWTFDQLCKSNLNLRYTSHPLSSCSKDNSRNLHPLEDLSQSLAGKAVVFRPLQ